ncbi:hypothetical protein N7530_008786 [Penicillium desertorum]|uniref:Major facilitator superfamily (MFS) profile domain-containing protein n=1 Tax=Penicillium desertorum TaxID=1303715 RepID=A0A9X0BLB7_9EURO|nr:hypothetical protein N7530_008786 [Penicillium desertorum]
MSSSSLKDGQKSLERDKDLVPNSSQIEVGKASFHDSIELDEIEHTDTGWYIWLIALAASIGGMLFGYDTEIISAVLVYLEDSLGHLLSAKSPRQLIYHDKHEEARTVLHRIFRAATPEQVQDKINLIEAGVRESQASTGNQTRSSIVKQLHTNPAYFRALVCACGLMTISQMSGFNVLMYYSGTLFALVGFANPVAVGLVVSGTNLAMTLVNMLVVDSFGRRRLLVTTSWGMSASLVAVAVSFAYIPVDLETLAVTTKSITTPAIIVLVFIILFVLFYGVSIGNTAWMSADFFPKEVRAVGTINMTCCCWGSNLIVSSTFLSMMKGITPSGAFGFDACLTFIDWVMIIFFYPEMSGLQLEEIREVFKHGFGVRYASRLRKQRAEDSRARLS